MTNKGLHIAPELFQSRPALSPTEALYVINSKLAQLNCAYIDKPNGSLGIYIGKTSGELDAPYKRLTKEPTLIPLSRLLHKVSSTECQFENQALLLLHKPIETHNSW
jgi:hypothetical protein